MIKKNVSIMYKYISAFPRDLERELQESNAAILKERVTPITRSNDGRIKKIYDNTEEVITKHAEELQEVMDQLDEIGETIRDENPYDTRLETIAQMMSDSYEKLHIFLPIEVFKEKKTFKYTVKTKYRILARKWAKIYENLPSVQLKTLEEEFDTVTKKIKDKEEELEEANYQIETQQELYHYKSEELSEIEQRLNITKTEIESEQNELKNMRYDQELKRKGYQEITRNLNKDLSEKQERERFLECQIKELRQEADKKARLSIQIKKMENMVLELLLDTKDKIEMDERQNKEQAGKASLSKKKKAAEYENLFQKKEENRIDIIRCQKRIEDVNQVILGINIDFERMINEYSEEQMLLDKNLQDITKKLTDSQADIEEAEKQIISFANAIEKKNLQINELQQELQHKQDEVKKIDRQMAKDEKEKNNIAKELELLNKQKLNIEQQKEEQKEKLA